MPYSDKQEKLELELESLIETLHILKDSRETASDSANELLTEYISNDIHEVLIEITKTSRALCKLTASEHEIGFVVVEGNEPIIDCTQKEGLDNE